VPAVWDEWTHNPARLTIMLDLCSEVQCGTLPMYLALPLPSVNINALCILRLLGCSNIQVVFGYAEGLSVGVGLSGSFHHHY
jgi:hypothetical protein